MTRTFSLSTKRGSGRIDYAAELNPEQLAVATAAGGPMLVVAGAGSGKTRALTYRLAWLVEQGVAAANILLVTFTNRAAREMLARVDALVRENTNELWGGTFHHIANRILRLYGEHVGVSPDFTILDREDSQSLLRTCVAEAGVSIEKRRFPGKSLLISISSFIQNTLDPLETVLTKRYPMFQRERDGIAAVLALYDQHKRERQLLDYDDLLARWLQLLEQQPDVRSVLAKRFRHILVDEYQDTNAIQGRIVDLLASAYRNVCVVGDDSQSIYSFRGASFDNISNFTQRYPDAAEFRLETNYRSTPEILAVANASIAHNQRRLPKELRAVRPSGLVPAVVACRDHYQQSDFLAEYILHLLDQERRLGDIAILYRSHWHALEIQLELKRRNIPFQVRGGLRFFEQAHIKDVLCWLRVVHNPRDELAWLRVLPLLPRIGSQLARRVCRVVRESPQPIAEARAKTTVELLPETARKPYRRFARLLGDLAALESPAEMIDRLLGRFYDDYLKSHYDGAELRREDLRGLADFASQYPALDGFLADVALAGEFSGETVVSGPEEQEFVVLSTVHQAKGLEWPVVMIPWLADGRFPTDLAINTPEEEAEERRVFHVAVTRAKDELYLVVPKLYRNRSRGMVVMKPSRFLTELGDGVTEPLVLE